MEILMQHQLLWHLHQLQEYQILFQIVNAVDLIPYLEPNELGLWITI